MRLQRCVHWKCGTLDGDGISSIFDASVIDGVFLPPDLRSGCDVCFRTMRPFFFYPSSSQFALENCANETESVVGIQVLYESTGQHLTLILV